ncbi:urease accessory protein UreD [Limibaculum sp. FT325]|uniref:urease accessory protein UreD n=1 Tax=Thermohalobaculum sediminis TaxID=2939436 RepID=UPI0020C09E68|nr:urease accessory protein UreD [Limibaculum sediminis]MCL5777934.1 urease accessory protein UreD [Limibaculum sediminis]
MPTAAALPPRAAGAGAPLAGHPRQPRALGAVRVGVRAGEVAGAAARLADLYQQGSARCLLPAGEPAATAVLINTAGGITGGDRFAWQAHAGSGAGLVLATQTAERAYRAQPGETGRVETRLTLGPGAWLDWLAQETILFDGAALDRRLTVEMAVDARLLVVEPVVLGRAAMGETVAQARFTDRWEIRREGRLIRAEATRLDGPVARIAARPAVLDGMRAFATILYAGPDAEQKLGIARALLPKDRAAASFLRGTLSIRLAAPDGARLRSALSHFLTGFRAHPLPRVWTM